MALATGFSNAFNSGEIFPDAQDRVDIQPIDHGCQLARNMMVQITGPLKKRRGFWSLGQVSDPSQMARTIPFRRSVDDALMLVFCNDGGSGAGVVSVLSANGAPLDLGAGPVTFAHPYTNDQLAGLRFRQVADVIYFTHSLGLAPQALERLADDDWAFHAVAFPNGPWLPENADDTRTVTFSGATDVVDGNPTSFGAAAIMTGETATLTASGSLFDAGMVGSILRIRQSTGNPSMRSWYAGFFIPVGWFIASVGNVYICTATGGSDNQASMSTPPTQTSGVQNDGCNTFSYLHDGAGEFRIDAYVSPTVVTGTVTSTLPVGNAQPTSLYSFPAYGPEIAWPRAWPSAVEERLVTGGTVGNLDMLDLTRTAGFTPLALDYHPGQGTGTVLDTDAIRRRMGDDGAEILWTRYTNWLLVGTASGEFLVSGGLFGEPITPASVVARPLSQYGSEDVYPAKGHRGIYFVCRGAQTLRKIFVDMQQSLEDDDLSFLAMHIAQRGMVQLAWLPQPDFALWVRLRDGGVACLTIHDEQQVKGWTSQQIGDGSWLCEDMTTLPGPGRLDTLWLLVSRRIEGGAVQRVILMQSQASDGLFMDLAQFYAGAPATVFDGLELFAGHTVRILADGGQLPDQVVSAEGTVTLAQPASKVTIGQPLSVEFQSLKLQTQYAPPGTLNLRKQVAGAVVSLLTAECKVSIEGSAFAETVNFRTGLATGPVKGIKDVTLSGGDDRDPRLVIVEDSAYDFGIFSIKPRMEAGGS